MSSVGGRLEFNDGGKKIVTECGWIWRRHSEGFLVSEGILDKIEAAVGCIFMENVVFC